MKIRMESDRVARPVVQLAPRVFLHEARTPPPEVPPGGLALAQRPSAAFGDGSHPTTRLCAGALDLLCRTRRPEAVLDVGTGTAVLARIARARGARFVVGTDIDPIALASARENVALDEDRHPAAPPIITDAAPDAWGARFDLVVANILEPILLGLQPALVRALAPRGALLLSGFTPPQSPSLRAAFADELPRVTEATLDGWSMLMLER